MKLQIIIFTIILVILFSCDNKERLNEKEVKEVLSEFMNHTISNFLPHSICCQFLSDLSDSSFKEHVLNLMKAKGQFDSTNHSKVLLAIYSKHKGKSIIPYINVSKYKYFKHLDYFSKDSISIMHLVISYPILYNNNKNCFIYTLRLYPKDSVCSQRLFVYSKKNGKWVGDFMASININLPKFAHKDYGAIVLRKWLKK